MKQKHVTFKLCWWYARSFPHLALCSARWVWQRSLPSSHGGSRRYSYLFYYFSFTFPSLWQETPKWLFTIWYTPFSYRIIKNFIIISTTCLPRKIETELYKYFAVCIDESGVAEFTHVYLDIIMLQVLIYLSSHGVKHREEYGGTPDESTITSAQRSPTRISGWSGAVTNLKEEYYVILTRTLRRRNI